MLSWGLNQMEDIPIFTLGLAFKWPHRNGTAVSEQPCSAGVGCRAARGNGLKSSAQPQKGNFRGLGPRSPSPFSPFLFWLGGFPY